MDDYYTVLSVHLEHTAGRLPRGVFVMVAFFARVDCP
jgi:hypothetical protein